MKPIVKVPTGKAPKEITDKPDDVIPEMDDMDGEGDDTEETKEGDDKEMTINKEELKEVMKEVEQENRLKYTVECRSADECRLIIKLAQARIKELDKKGSDGSSQDSPKSIGY